jgi:hypothetical protein
VWARPTWALRSPWRWRRRSRLAASSPPPRWCNCCRRPYRGPRPSVPEALGGLRPTGDAPEARSLGPIGDHRGGDGQAGAPLPHHRDQRRELPPKGSCCRGFQGSRRPANVIDASAMAGTINSSTAPAKGAQPATRKLAHRLRRSSRAANWIGAPRQAWARSSSNLHSSRVVGPKPSPLTGQPN